MPSHPAKAEKLLKFTARGCVLAGLFQLAACAAPEAADDDAAMCEANPELVTRQAGVRPQRLTTNGQNLNAGYMNGVALQRLTNNGQNLNGVSLNGVSLNGVQLNGVQLNGVALGGAAGNELVGAGADGRAVSGAAFVGAKIPALLSDGTTIDLEVTSFERSSLDADVALYGLAHEGLGLCPEGETGMFVSGTWDAHGARTERTTIGGATATASYSCVSGVIAKCVMWGYAPWRTGAALHQTCTRMARADYCGTGVSFTKNGTLIDVFDVAGIQSPESGPELLFEAGWNENGATCVSRPRYESRRQDGTAIMPSCWASLPRCAGPEEAKALGATMMNASRPQSRRICD